MLRQLAVYALIASCPSLWTLGDTEYLSIVDIVLMGFEQAVYTVGENDGSIMLCVNLASPVIQRSTIVSFQTSSISESAVGK